jgi:MFS family permease
VTTTAPPASLWRDARFRSYWAGQAISQFGDRVTELALPLIAVVILKASPAQVGLLTAAVWLPYLISLLVGSWVDHQRQKRRLLVIADLARAVVLMSLPIAYAFRAVTLLQLFAVALLTGLGQVFFNTAYPTVFVNLVPREAYIDANSKFSTTRSISFIAGPAVGGLLIQILTAPVAVIVDAISFLASAFLVGRIPMTERELHVDDSVSLWRRAIEGMTFLVHHRYLRVTLACATTVNFFSFVGSALLVLFASRTLGLSAGLIGTAFGIGATGGLVGALAAPRLAERFGMGTIIIAGAIIFPAALAVPVLAAGPTLAKMSVLAIAEFFSGVGVMLFDVNLNSLQTSVTPDGMRSRVAGAFSTINYGVRPFGAVVGGVLGSGIGLRPTLIVAATGGALSCLWLLPSPIRRVKGLAELDAIDPYTGLSAPGDPSSVSAPASRAV